MLQAREHISDSGFAHNMDKGSKSKPWAREYCCFASLHVLLRFNNNLKPFFIRKTQILFASFLSLASQSLSTKKLTCYEWQAQFPLLEKWENTLHSSLIKCMELISFGDFNYTIGLLFVVVNCHTHVYMWTLDAGNWVCYEIYVVVYCGLSGYMKVFLQGSRKRLVVDVWASLK